MLKDVGVFVGGEMFTDASGEVSIGFTNITGITAGVPRESEERFKL